MTESTLLTEVSTEDLQAELNKRRCARALELDDELSDLLGSLRAKIKEYNSCLPPGLEHIDMSQAIAKATRVRGHARPRLVPPGTKGAPDKLEFTGKKAKKVLK